MILEIVRHPERFASFLAELDQLMDEGLVTKEKVRVIIVRHSEAKKNQAKPKPQNNVKAATTSAARDTRM